VPDNSHSVLFLDKKGILKYVYRYADIAFIGGGFDKTVHNVSEAAVYGIPTIFGPNYQNFEDANIFVELHIAFDGADEYKTENLLKQVSIYDERRIIAANKLNSYFSNREKTSERIISEILK
jgi:3-deoxy-D-manno-octulosonic-acid transferase